MTQTNQNKDYSWQWLEEILEKLHGELFRGDRILHAKDDAKAAIITRIDEHYIGKGEAHHQTVVARGEGYDDGYANRTAAFESEVEQRCIEARIDELRQIRKWGGTIFHNDIMDYCGDRIEQLSTNNKDKP